MEAEKNRDPRVEAVWRSYLTKGRLPEGQHLPWYEASGMRAVARRLPSDPRCQVCYYPFSGMGGRIVRSLIGLERSRLNPHLCNTCERFAEENPGGTELEVSLLFVDIRGSTPLAETMQAYDYSRLIDRFYKVTTNIIYDHGGMVEKLVGDEVAAFFAPAFAADHNHARAAVQSAQIILAETGHGGGQAPWVPLGAGVHTGEAYVGAVGEPGKNLDITVLGDNVNVGSRLAGQALAGEIVISDSALRAAGMAEEGLEFRRMDLKGKEAQVGAWIWRA